MFEHGNAEEAAPARVVLLGGGGFVGRTLAPLLDAAGTPHLSLSSADIDLSADGAGDALADILKPDDAVVMLAALTPDRGRGVDAFMRNVAMTANLARAVEKTAPAHLVYFSSDAVYPLGAGAVTEESCSAADDLYGTMHVAREAMLTAGCPCPLAVLRPALIYGAADTHNSYGPNRLRRMARDEGRITLFGDGEETRDHILVDDVAALTVRVLTRRCAGILNLATGKSVSFADLARLVADRFDGDIAVEGTPRQNPITHRNFDITALIRAFPDFTFTPLAEGIAKAHRDMVENGLD